MDVRVDFEKAAIARISKEIGDIPYKARRIFQLAVSDTTKAAEKLEKQAIKEEYHLGRSAGSHNISLQKEVRKKAGTYANPVGEILSVSAMKRMNSYFVTPRKLAIGSGRPKVYKANSLRKNKPVAFARSGPNGRSDKAFMVQFPSGHKELVHKVYGETYKQEPYKSYRKSHGYELTKIEPVYSAATPFLVSKTWRKRVEAETGAILQKNIRKYIDQFLEVRDSK